MTNTNKLAKAKDTYKNLLFTGDNIFIGGVGKFFEGNAT